MVRTCLGALLFASIAAGCAAEPSRGELIDIHVFHDPATGRLQGTAVLSLDGPFSAPGGDIRLVDLRIEATGTDPRTVPLSPIDVTRADDGGALPVALPAGGHADIPIRFEATSPFLPSDGFEAWCGTTETAVNLTAKIYDAARDDSLVGQEGLHELAAASAVIQRLGAPRPSGFTSAWSMMASSRHDDFTDGLAVDGAGNSYVVSRSAFGTSGLMKVDALGGRVWAVESVPREVAARGDVVVVAYDLQTPLISRIGEDGTPLWETSLVGGGVESAGLGVDDKGEITVVSRAYGDYRLTKLDAGGALVWEKTLAASSSEISVEPSGAVIVAGYFSPGFDAGGGALSGGAIVKLDAAGQFVWQRSLGNANVTALSADGQGIFLAGSLGGPSDLGGGPLPAGAAVFVAKLDPSGNHVWSKGFGTGNVVLSSIAADEQGRVMISGAVRDGGSVDFGAQPIDATRPEILFLAQIGAAGDVVRGGAVACGGPSLGASSLRLASRAGGDFMISGSFYDVLSLGQGGQSPLSLGGSDGFLARLRVE